MKLYVCTAILSAKGRVPGSCLHIKLGELKRWFECVHQADKLLVRFQYVECVLGRL
jgi:hypothetical protein